jgi:hypothetical protein
MTEDHGLAEHEKRVTAPQQAYTLKQVQYGFVVLLIGLLLTFVVPLLLV